VEEADVSQEGKKNSTQTLQEQLGASEREEGTVPEEEALLEHPSYEALQTKLTDTEEKAEKLRDQLLRMQAEIENIHRRSRQDVANAHKFALEKFILELLPVIDNLERAIAAHITDESGAGTLLDGVSLTLKMFRTTLEKWDVEEINPLNQPFNPEFHQAVSMQKDPKIKPGTVLNVLQKGYLLNKRLIRPALVVVAQ